jgi:hypothetical protein
MLLLGLKSITNIIARKRIDRGIQFPNYVLNVGLMDEVTQSMPQINFYNAIPQKQAKINDDLETGSVDASNKGALTIPNTKDYYMGESLG